MVWEALNKSSATKIVRRFGRLWFRPCVLRLEIVWRDVIVRFLKLYWCDVVGRYLTINGSSSNSSSSVNGKRSQIGYHYLWSTVFLVKSLVLLYLFRLPGMVKFRQSHQLSCAWWICKTYRLGWICWTDKIALRSGLLRWIFLIVVRYIFSCSWCGVNNHLYSLVYFRLCYPYSTIERSYIIAFFFG